MWGSGEGWMKFVKKKKNYTFSKKNIVSFVSSVQNAKHKNWLIFIKNRVINCLQRILYRKQYISEQSNTIVSLWVREIISMMRQPCMQSLRSLTKVYAITVHAINSINAGFQIRVVCNHWSPSTCSIPVCCQRA